MSLFSSFKKREDSSIVFLAQAAISASQKEQVIAERAVLVQLFNEVQKASSCLRVVSDFDVVGSAFALMGGHSVFMDNEDARRVIADNAFYCLSKAIERNSKKETYFKRLLVLALFHKDFFYTIANAMDIPDDDIMSVGFPLIVKTNKYYYDMAFHDFQVLRLSSYPVPIDGLYSLICRKAAECDAQRGKQYISKVVKYLDDVYKRY